MKEITDIFAHKRNKEEELEHALFEYIRRFFKILEKEISDRDGQIKWYENHVNELLKISQKEFNENREEIERLKRE